MTTIMGSGVGEDILRAHIAALEAALQDIIAADCCDCSLHSDIAKDALGIENAEPEGPPEPVVVVARGFAGTVTR